MYSSSYLRVMAADFVCFALGGLVVIPLDFLIPSLDNARHVQGGLIRSD